MKKTIIMLAAAATLAAGMASPAYAGSKNICAGEGTARQLLTWIFQNRC